MNNMEIRFQTSDLTTTDEGVMLVEGLVNKTESWSNELGQRRKFKEKINRGAFAKALVEAPRVDFLMEHDGSKLLATTQNGSLTLFEDEEGLKMRAEIVPTTYGKDLYALMRSKIINHMSFGFRVINDKWKKLTDGTYQREIDSLQLIEVSAVRNPAYPQSMIHARGLNVVENEDELIPDNVEEERTEQEIQTETSPEPIQTESVVATAENISTQEQPQVEQTQPQVEQVVETTPEVKEVTPESVLEKTEPQVVTTEQFEKLMQIVSTLNDKLEKVVVPFEQPKQEVVQEQPKAETVDLSKFYEKIKQPKEM